MIELSKAEEITLLAVWRLGDNAYGVTIRNQIEEETGKDYTYGTLYGFLRQLDSKGLVVKRMGEITPEKGGRRKTYFDLTPRGKTTLKEIVRFHRQVWLEIDELSIDRL